MPRLPTSLILKAYRENPLLQNLLKECRTLESARNELRWLREGAIGIAITAAHSRYPLHNTNTTPPTTTNNKNNYSLRQTGSWQRVLREMCALRSKGEPLQYILGDQPFGELEILCEKGVLIPRPETELYTIHTKDLIVEGLDQSLGLYIAKSNTKKSLRVLDVCSGSGCISLLLHSLLVRHVENLTIAGLDVSSRALSLAQRNKAHNISKGLLDPRAENEITFCKFDLFDELDTAGGFLPIHSNLSNNNNNNNASMDAIDAEQRSRTWDILISNPPYISPSDLRGSGKTSRSVRRYEPLQALVPPAIKDSRLWDSLGLRDGVVSQADIFYPRLLSLARRLDVKLAVFECGDPAQAQRVVDMAWAVFKKEKEGDGPLSVYSWSGYEASSDCDGGARAVVVKRF